MSCLENIVRSTFMPVPRMTKTGQKK